MLLGFIFLELKIEKYMKKNILEKFWHKNTFVIFYEMNISKKYLFHFLYSLFFIFDIYIYMF